MRNKSKESGSIFEIRELFISRRKFCKYLNLLCRNVYTHCKLSEVFGRPFKKIQCNQFYKDVLCVLFFDSTIKNRKGILEFLLVLHFLEFILVLFIGISVNIYWHVYYEYNQTIMMNWNSLYSDDIYIYTFLGRTFLVNKIFITVP